MIHALKAGCDRSQIIADWLDRNLPWNPARPFAELDQVQFGERPSWINHGSSSANGRAGSTTDSARPFAELDQVRFGERLSWINHGFSSAFRRSGPSPVQRTAELDQPQILSSPRPRNFSPDIASNSLLFRLNWRYRWNFTI
ncbi:hypothetical protein DY000_02053177 [Brassica cretica]|uniref:Uncharacterized protein n=1 Tax=Brassica cretica TaxID=69181 RepID=A0ABQ7A7E8_BRACR|nr:hypothetical protein DY000_02053177 [Brassica cretica]